MISILSFLLSIPLIIFGIYGLLIAFSASLLLGVFYLLVIPLAVITGFVMFIFDVNIAQIILNLF